MTSKTMAAETINCEYEEEKMLSDFYEIVDNSIMKQFIILEIKKIR